MKKQEKIISFIIKEDLAKAKDTIFENLNEKLNSILREKFDEYAPAVFEAAKPDFLDLDKDGNTEEPMKQAAAQAEGEDEDEMEEDEEQSDSEEEENAENEDGDEDSEEEEADEEEED